jgi:hypothetical protein
MRATNARIGNQRDKLVSIEKVHGTRFADVMRGDPNFSTSSRNGDDRLVGRRHLDYLVGEGGDDRAWAAPETTTFRWRWHDVAMAG